MAVEPRPGAVAADRLFRQRRRPGLRLVAAGGAVASLAGAAGAAVWLRIAVVPPDCADPATLAAVRRNLVDLGLPDTLTIGAIHTRSGGYLAFRFACEADLENIDAGLLPPGTPVPRSATYVSRLTHPDGAHEVTVSIRPLLRLERVQ